MCRYSREYLHILQIVVSWAPSQVNVAILVLCALRGHLGLLKQLSDLDQNFAGNDDTAYILIPLHLDCFCESINMHIDYAKMEINLDLT